MKIFDETQRDIEQVVEKFESAWFSGERPKIDDYLPANPKLRAATMIELVGADIEMRLRAGEPARIEDYVRIFPELAHDAAQLANLVQLEYDLRSRREPRLQRAEFDERFPQLAHLLSAGEGWQVTGPKRRVVGTVTDNSGRFRLLRPYAEGGLGCIWLAHDDELNREVAIKEMKSELADDDACSARFLQEAAIAGRLQHPGIVSVYGAGKHLDGRPYYAMRFVRGKTLQAAIDAHFATGQQAASDSTKNIERRRLLHYLISVCHTIDYAHQQGVLHRDIKPNNIMIGDYGETVVVDWGLAKLLKQSDWHDAQDSRAANRSAAGSLADLSRAGRVFGSPAYMSPEQARGEHDQLTVRSDVCSLGATLYSILTNRPPVTGSSSDELLERAKNSAWPAPSQIDRAIPKPLESICLKAMAPKAEDRYESPRALAEDLEHFLADEPTLAHQENWLERGARLTRRHRLLVWGTFAALLAISFVTSTSSIAILQQKMKAEALADERDAMRHKVARVVESMKNVWAMQGPHHLGPNVTLAEATDYVGDHLDEFESMTEPLVRASFHDFLGQVYLSRGEHDRALQHAQEAVAAFQAELGDDGLETLRAKRGLAAVHSDTDPEQAVRLFEDVIHRLTSALGAAHRDTCQTRIMLAHTLARQGKKQEALTTSQRVLKDISEDSGDHELLAGACNGVAYAYYYAGQFADAAELFERALVKAQSHLPPKHEITHAAVNGLASSLSRLGRNQQVVDLLESERAAAEINMGPRHPLTLTYGNNLGVAYQNLGRVEEALAIFQEVWPARTEKLGEGHLNTIIVMNNLAMCYGKLGNNEKSFELFQQLNSICQRDLTEGNPERLRAMHNLACVHGFLGTVDEGILLMNETVRLRTQYLGAHPDTVASMLRLGALYEMAGRFNEAVDQLEEVQQIIGELDCPPRHEALRLFTRVQLRQKKFSEAARLSQAWLAFLQTSESSLPKDHPTALMLHGEAQLGQQDVDAAKASLDAAYAKLASSHTPEGLTAHVQSLRGEVAIAQGNPTEAKAMLQQACELFDELEANDKVPAQLKYRVSAASRRLKEVANQK